MDRKNKTGGLFMVLLGVILFASGCGAPRPDAGRIWRRQEPSLPPVPAATFESGQQAYLQKSYALAASRMGAYSDAYPRTARSLEARYWQGMSLLELGHVRRGRMLLEEVSNSNLARRSLRALALRGLAKSYLDEQNYEKAEEIYTRLKTQYPEESDNSETRSALAQCRGAGKEPSASDYTVASGEKHYLVQAGSFTSRAFADRLVKRLAQAGIQAIVMHRGGRYVVQAGSFSTRERAQTQATRLQNLGFEAIVK